MTLLEYPTASITADEFDLMIEGGIFEKRRVALINGVIVEMPAQGEPHWLACHRTARYLEKTFGDGWVIRTAAPFRVDKRSQPEPDVLVYKGLETDFLKKGRPTTGDLVVEVSQSTLRVDRKVMAKLYAGTGIPEYWILNLRDRQLEVYRDPDTEERTYRSREIILPGQVISPLARPRKKIDPAWLLP